MQVELGSNPDSILITCFTSANLIGIESRLNRPPWHGSNVHSIWIKDGGQGSNYYLHILLLTKGPKDKLGHLAQKGTLQPFNNLFESGRRVLASPFANKLELLRICASCTLPGHPM